MTTKTRMFMERLTRSVRTRDTLLTPPTAAELAAWGSEPWELDLGLVFEGGLKPILNALRTDDRAKAVKRLTDELAGYAKFQSTGGSVANNGSPSFGTAATAITDGAMALRQERNATSAVLRKMNEDNRRAAAERWPL